MGFPEEADETLPETSINLGEGSIKDSSDAGSDVSHPVSDNTLMARTAVDIL